MMGRQTADQRQLFYQFNLDERIPMGHLLRRIDVFVVRALAGLINFRFGSRTAGQAVSVRRSVHM